MNHPSLLALGYSEAAMLLRQSSGAPVRAIISICGHNEHAVDPPVTARTLHLCFDDVDAPDLTSTHGLHRAWIRKKWAHQTGRLQTPPTIEDAKAIIQFAQEVKDVNGVVLCHCQGGISRSPAAALLCLATWTGAGHETHCVDQLLQIRPCAAPHPGLITFGDTVLGRNGALFRAVVMAQKTRR
jgi:predicted protein tyrosine phosphatase